MVKCREALKVIEGDHDAAIAWLRTQGILKGREQQARVATEGLQKKTGDFAA